MATSGPSASVPLHSHVTNSSTTLGFKKGMAIASINVNSLLRHIDEIRLLVKDLGIHILAVNETKIDDNIDDDLVSIEGYLIKRSNRNGGGVAVYVKDMTFDKITVRADLPLSNLEGLCIEVKPVKATPFLVMSWYRPPDASFEIFRQLEECLQVLDKENRDIILLGDTNCDFLPIISDTEDICTPENLPPHSKNLLEIYNRFGLEQLIKRSTRETLTTATLIDHIATTNRAFIVESGVYKTTICDHYLVYCVKRFRDTAKKQH